MKKKWTLTEIKKRSQETGHHFWDKENMEKEKTRDWKFITQESDEAHCIYKGLLNEDDNYGNLRIFDPKTGKTS
jgi:hypothetical protein